MKTYLSFVLGTLIVISFCVWLEYNSELKQSYDWAYQNKITTQDTIDKANMKWRITRAELAKMISNYAINVLWKDVNVNNECVFDDVSDAFDKRYDYWILHSCQLWLMGQNIKNFRPNNYVTRAEFGTVLSRVLWWDNNEWWSTYYEKHLKALKSVWIMNKISSPMDNEIRWYVMLMLMRSVNQDIDNVSLDLNDNQIFEVVELLD